ncbi:MAG: xylene monooxygenase, partial [Candidatus Omnitrophica bacterium]|nr:xylene monooxygenase [Candidatus Omnitrophota bacterium]
MTERKAVFVERIDRTPTVASFRFRTEGGLEFIPGQFLEVMFNESDRKDRCLNKYLSFSAAPGKEYVEVTKRMSESAFSGR